MLNLEYLAALLNRHREAAHARVRTFTVGNQLLDFNQRPAIMGVINLSPDSWYRESVCLNLEQAVRRASVLHAQGADLIDLGAESTLAHAARADDHIQKAKLIPLLREVGALGIPLSIETYDIKVAQTGLENGAAVINFTGRDTAADIYTLVAQHRAAVIICHVQGANVREVEDLKLGPDATPDFINYFRRQIDLATSCGVEKIFLDPGLGFYYRNLQDSAKRIQYQMGAFLHTFRLRTLGYPVCHALPHAFEFFGEEVRCAEPFFAVLGALGKTDLFRTHEVPRVRAVLETLRQYAPHSDEPSESEQPL